ncbi:MAG: DUF4058 family protein [Burkholderiales bacterium]|nr:DUF4058 family protein [Anaerolineae bacterium]
MSELEPIFTLKNQYRGINPHLQSILVEVSKDPSVWPSFHSDHMTNIAEFLNRQLPMRYIARTEASLQILVDDVFFEPRFRKSIPYVAIYEREIASQGSFAPTALMTGFTWQTALENTLDPEEEFVRAVVIHTVEEHGILGQAVARIELISPSNKPGRTGYPAYQKARIDALYSGTPLIEVDYIHELPATVPTYPLYPKAANSQPYTIFINDPRPTVMEGKVRGYGFAVDSLLPTLALPLAGEESLDFDFNAVYQYTYQSGRWGFYVDYRETPLRLHTYNLADQARIQQRMAAVAGAYAQGIDLEQETR